MKFSVNAHAARVPRGGYVDTEQVPAVGDSVTLRSGSHVVRVLVTEAHHGRYRGVVAAFFPPAQFANGILMGASVHFDYANVFEFASSSGAQEEQGGNSTTSMA